MEQLLKKHYVEAEDEKGHGQSDTMVLSYSNEVDDPFNSSIPTQEPKKLIQPRESFKNQQKSFGQKYLGKEEDAIHAQGMKRTGNWIIQQERAFKGWVNAYLSTRQMGIKNLEKDIAQVTPIIHLLEILEKKQLKGITKYHKKPRHKFDKLDGMRICLTQIKSRGRKNIPLGFDAEILLSGNDKKICLALIWRIIVNYAIEATDAEEVVNGKKRNFHGPEQRLLFWCNQRLPKNLQISNFTKNFQDGNVFCHLLNCALEDNDKINSIDIKDMDSDEILDGCFQLAENRLAIPQLLDVDEMITDPDKQSVMTYVSLIRTAIEAKESERSAATQSMNKMKETFQSLEEEWVERVRRLEAELEKERLRNKEQDKLLQNERNEHGEQIYEWKEKNNYLYEEIDKLKRKIDDNEYKKSNDLEKEKEINLKLLKQNEDLKKNIITLQNQNAEINDALISQAQKGAKKNTGLQLQFEQMKQQREMQKDAYEKRIKELEIYIDEQRKRFNDFYKQYKDKLDESNKTGREFREKFIVIQSDTDALKKRIKELEELLKIKETEIIELRKREKQLTEQIQTQEAVFRIQLQELGQFIKQMKQREADSRIANEEQFKAIQKEYDFRRKTIDKQYQLKKRKSKQELTDEELAKAMQAEYDNNNNNDIDNFKPAPPKTKPPLVQKNKMYYKTTEITKSKFGNEKFVTTWYYKGKDDIKHKVVLKHNTKGKKSKRVIQVDDIERYNDKTTETYFWIKNGKDHLKLNIIDKGKGAFSYSLIINDVPFQKLYSK